ncbi:MAG: hypothetical protein AB8E15_11290 [Bdellovibrionales bacterium]
MKNFVLLLVVLCLPTIVPAGEFKIRAREHFEQHRVKGTNFEEKFRGLSNTMNFWWEKPYDISYGFYFSPIIAKLREQQQGSVFGARITFINLGVETKYHFQSIDKSLFTRVGLGISQVLPRSDIGNKNGWNIYGGLGYEYPFDNFGMAVELAYRYAALQDDIEIISFTPSIGFHFYKSM